MTSAPDEAPADRLADRPGSPVPGARAGAPPEAPDQRLQLRRLQRVVSSRRMVRSFETRPLDATVVRDLLELTASAPSAGNSRGTAWIWLEGDRTDRYWAAATTVAWRDRSKRWSGLSRAPVVLLSLCSPEAYVRRYAEPDKAASNPGGPALGVDPTAWPVPYWFGDAAFETMLVLLGAEAAGLAACFLGAFRGEGEVLRSFGVPEGWRLFGAVLLGHADGHDHRSTSLDRRAARPRIHRGAWDPGDTVEDGSHGGGAP